jgi:hypothetical protein
MFKVDCAFFATVSDLVTVEAAAKLEFPLWSAVKVQVPAVTIETVFPYTVHTEAVEEAKVMLKVEVAEAVSVKSASP